MLRQDSPLSSDRNRSGNSAGNSTNGVPVSDAARVGSVDLQQELNKLEELILDSPRIPLSRCTLIDEEQLLDQLDLVRLNLPSAFQEASDIIRQKEEILLEAEQYAQEIVEAAEQRAAQLLDEMGLLRQAELEVQQLRQRAQQECQSLQEKAIAEIEQKRRMMQQELEEMRRMTVAECEEIQAGADDYADRVLQDIEHQLSEMMRVIRNGRSQLQPEPPPTPVRSREMGAGAASGRPPQPPKPPDNRSKA